MDGKSSHQQLQRRLGVFAAVMLGLGAMVGTGVFVSIGIAAGVRRSRRNHRRCSGGTRARL